MQQLIREIQAEHLRDPEAIPQFRPGDTVKVHLRLVDELKTRKADKSTGAKATEARVQAFEGVCIARRGTGIDETFTLRRASGQVGVERTFLLNSPHIDKIEVTRLGRVRRAKLYYLRERVGKRARVKAARHKGA
ncbi:MAG: 50S ribosomal protein L19 [Armatimonadetes bacterium]|nr:50S ribosomal protein L19 [Armatimonadota bacterium]